MLAVQIVLVLFLVGASLAVLILQARANNDREAQHRSLAVASAVADSPSTASALRSAHPSALLQPRMERLRRDAQVDFVVVTDIHGTRFSHPDPRQIGRKFIGNLEPARHGRNLSETINGMDPLGPVQQSIVPVRSGGKVVGMVAAGVTAAHVEVATNSRLPFLIGGAGVALGLAALGTGWVSKRLRRQTHGLGPAEMTRMYEHHDAVLHAVREGVVIVDENNRLVLANDEARRLLRLPDRAEGRRVCRLGLSEDVVALLTSRETVTDQVVTAHGRPLAVSSRPTVYGEESTGGVTTLRDYTELRALAGKAEVARGRLDLIYQAGMRIGTTLDVRRTAEELCEVAVPDFTDFVTVSLAEPVLRGEEPDPREATSMVRVALRAVREDHPLHPVGHILPGFGSAGPVHGKALERDRATLVDLRTDPHWQQGVPEEARRVLEYGIHSVIAAPLRARGVLLGIAHFWRSETAERFDDEDVAVAEELAARAAVCIDNARRFAREHATAVTLQHRLLPRALPDQSAVDIASHYRAAQSTVGGDWFDVIPLSGARVALVVGDVVGHGLHAAATMGRLRTAIHNFSALDIAPDELLSHLDELIITIEEAESEDDDSSGGPVAGATCVYAVYDPVDGRCTLARAGHVPPAVVMPDGTVVFPDLPSGLPLGVGDLPFQMTEVRLPEGSQLVLYTDGLIVHRDRDVDEGVDQLREALSRPEARESPERAKQTVLAALLPDEQRDDIALLVARARRLPPDHVAFWDLPPDPAAVSGVRSAIAEKLTAWGLEHLAFTTELIVSELATNAVRHSGGPARVRLMRERTLILEVADDSSTSPHLRYAASEDEGGRGLFLVAQMAERWGTRYTGTGKIIWAEQSLEPSTPDFGLGSDLMADL
ncbi:SpoIIE family protein phosphatase [Streptomyces sp. NPDC059740]|uniref:SpoIIE family protein phosphatase n=1 Tax=Streptomyces sp. NPDC059740 TaxID=3346926 RepID=UPI0036525FBC